jgi:HTH-type transcriptional regulator / antitoxin MqsA
MKCPACGHSRMVEKTIDEKLSYGGHSIILEGMKGEFCPKCGEGIWDSASSRRFDEAHVAVVTAARGDVGADIRRIRKGLNLTQAKLAESCGLGPLALSRYERGKTRPPASLVKLLRLLEKHPNLLEELRETDVAYHTHR